MCVMAADVNGDGKPDLIVVCGLMNNSLTVFIRTAVPTATTLPATAMTLATATLNGTAYLNGSATAAWFEWGATTSYGSLHRGDQPGQRNQRPVGHRPAGWANPRHHLSLPADGHQQHWHQLWLRPHVCHTQHQRQSLRAGAQRWVFAAPAFTPGTTK